MFKKVFITFITMLFACSALEIEIGEARQTFFDAYDSYITPETATVKETQASNYKIKKTGCTKKIDIKKYFLCFNVSYKTNFTASEIISGNFLSSRLPGKIHLQKSELRI